MLPRSETDTLPSSAYEADKANITTGTFRGPEQAVPCFAMYPTNPLELNAHTNDLRANTTIHTRPP